jgi:hypothetical protein
MFCLLFFHLACVGEALSADTLHHKHHAVVLLIPSTTPLHLAGPRRRSRRCVGCVQCSEAPPGVALGSDRITRRRRKYDYADHAHLNVSAVRSTRVCRSNISHLLFCISYIISLFSILRLCTNFFCFLCCETLQKYWAHSNLPKLSTNTTKLWRKMIAPLCFESLAAYLLVQNLNSGFLRNRLKTLNWTLNSEFLRKRWNCTRNWNTLILLVLVLRFPQSGLKPSKFSLSSPFPR